MSLTRKHLMILAVVLGLLALTACTREITTIVQEEPQPSSCFACHSDSDQFLIFAETQWAESRHGLAETLGEGDNSACARCHCSEGFLQFVAGETPTATTTPTPIGCFTCHAPHTNGDFGLRITEAVPLLNGDSADIGLSNGCVACHQARRDVAVYITASNSINNRYGPHHGPQGDLLLGSNGYEYPGHDYGDTYFHRTLRPEGAADGELGCVNCHMRVEAYQMGGHTFKTVYVNEETSASTYNPAACQACHTEYDGEDYDINGVRTEIDGLLTTLQGQLFDAGFVNATGTPVTRTGVNADDAGAIWNFMFIGKEDRSHGAHNPDYARDLLNATIDYMNTAHGETK